MTSYVTAMTACSSLQVLSVPESLTYMLPVVDELYDTDEEKVNALRTYTAFFNTEPQIGTMVVGLTVGLEEARANGETIDDETINGIRAGLMGAVSRPLCRDLHRAGCGW